MVKISNLSDQEFKVMVMKILTKVLRKVDQPIENFNEAIEYTGKHQQQWQSRKIELQNTAEGFNRLYNMEQFNELEDKTLELTWT